MNKRVAFLVAIGCLLGWAVFGSTELIGNGGFEGLTPDPWLASANGFTITPPIVGNPAQAHTGNNFASLGNANGPLKESLYQNIHIPGNALAVRYTYFWGCSVMGQDPPSAVGFLSVLQPTNQSPVYLATILSANVGYQRASFDLTSYAGKSVQIGYLVQSQTTNGFGAQTFFAVDDVSVRVFTSDDVPANDDFANATLLTTTTNISDAVTNIVATKEPGEPRHAGAAGGHSVWWKWVAPGNGSVVINTTNSTFNTVLAVYTGTVVSSLTPVASNDDGLGNGLSQVKFNVSAGQEYEIAVDGKGGSSGVAQINLAFSLDTKPPTVKITSPKNGTKLNGPAVTAHGTATDNLGVSLVQYRVENLAGTNDYQDAIGTTSWTAIVTGLSPGPNTLRVRAFDTSGNESEATETVSFVVPSLLTVNITGTGTVLPNLNGTQQPVGNTLTLTAKPGTGQSFSNWMVGDDTVTTAKLSFIMQSNLVVTANFVPNPFGPAVGTYQGLIYDTNGITPQNAGFFNAKLTGSGAFSAKINLAGKKLSLSGQFSAGGVFSNSIARKGSTPLSAQLNLDIATGDLTGVFSDGTNTTELVANRAVTSAGTSAGKYTLLIPGGTNGVAQPGGDSYATIVVSATGAISLKGVLSDGTKIAQKANLLTTGQWAFYVPLYSARGSILSWLTFSNSVIDGTTYWFKESLAGKLYPAGFTNVTDAAGSAYVFTKGVPVLNFSNGILALSNGNLSNSFIEGLALDSNSKVTSTNATVKMAITTATGLFKGSVKDPFSGRIVPFNGVVLQQQNSGGGFFIGFDQTGRVAITP
jgi:hypothetical protein